MDLNFIDRQKLKLVHIGYKEGTVFFKMFFDKWYRRSRHDAIVSKIDKYSNINEFRTMIQNKHADMPVATISNLYMFKPAKKEKE